MMHVIVALACKVPETAMRAVGQSSVKYADTARACFENIITLSVACIKRSDKRVGQGSFAGLWVTAQVHLDPVESGDARLQQTPILADGVNLVLKARFADARLKLVVV